MSDPEPNLEAQSLAGSEARINATNSSIGNASQVVNSPGAVVSQTHITQVQTSPALSRHDLIFGALLALAVLVAASKATIHIGLPPVVSQLVAGVLCAGIVWKFFEKVEGVLPEETKIEIAVWLVGRTVIGPKIETWPVTFIKVFDRVFGAKHISWRCFLRSTLASYAIVVVMWSLRALTHPGELSFDSPKDWLIIGTVVFLLNALPDYCSLLKSRKILHWMTREPSGQRKFLLFLAELFMTGVIGLAVTAYGGAIVANYASATLQVVSVTPVSKIVTPGKAINQARERSASTQQPQPPSLSVLVSSVRAGLLSVSWRFWNPGFDYLRYGTGFLWLYPTFFTTVWAWLYVVSGGLLKTAQRFDYGLRRFITHLDIERKPLQSLGFVAGLLVAVVYWTAMIVSRLIGT